MRAIMLRLIALLGVAAAAAIATYLALRPAPQRLPDSASVVQSVREVARLETLDVALFKKVRFKPDPPASDGVLDDLWNWARFSVSPPVGRAIVFGVAHLGLDLGKLGPEQLRLDGHDVWLVLPAVMSQIEVKPEETEVIDSNLDSKQTAALLAMAKEAMERDVKADAALQERATRSAERAIKALLMSLGFVKVHFVDTLPSELSISG